MFLNHNPNPMKADLCRQLNPSSIQLNHNLASTKFQLNLNLNLNLNLPSLQPQAQIKLSLNLNLNLIWLWHKSNAIYLVLMSCRKVQEFPFCCKSRSWLSNRGDSSLYLQIHLMNNSDKKLKFSWQILGYLYNLKLK